MDTSLLRGVLSESLGQELTPELAALIESVSRLPQDNPIDPSIFGESEYRGVVFRAEKLVDVLEELKPLHVAHFRETEGHHHHLKLEPDYEDMLMRERAGRLVQFTARREGELVGHIRMNVVPSIHFDCTTATEEVLYLSPEVRKGFTAVRFIQFVEESMRAIGVEEIRTDSKGGSARLMEYLGYTPISTKYFKRLSEEVVCPATHQIQIH